MNMKWIKFVEYRYPGPILHRIDWYVIEQKNLYYRVLGRAMVETRVNGKGTCFARVDITMFGQCGKWSTQLYRHFQDKKSPTIQAKKWCELLLQNPPHVDHEIDSSYKMLNGICKEQMKLAREESLDIGKVQ